jgi:uncharacterized membrane protein YgcG
MKPGHVGGILGILLVFGAIATSSLWLPSFDTGVPAEDWTVEHFDAQITINRDASIDIVETLGLDFGELYRHGIIRGIPVEYEYDRTHLRTYDLSVRSVTDGDGDRVPYSTSRAGADVEIKIGDPDRTVFGKQTYRIAYHVEGALNAFDDHDELYWNVNGGDWGVPFERVTATVSAPTGVTRVSCYQGREGSTETCRSSVAGHGAQYAATRPFSRSEQMTIVAALPKGAVAEPRPDLERWLRNPTRYFDLDPIPIAGAVFVGIVVVALLADTWWRHGRDREYTTLRRHTGNLTERIRPLFGRRDIIVEYTPPEGWRPAEMGLIVNEGIDDTEITATFIDLAARGYLRIDEHGGEGWFSDRKWLLTRIKPADDALQPYEQGILEGAFGASTTTWLHELPATFGQALKDAHEQLVDAAMARGWFAGKPKKVEEHWTVRGVIVVLAGAGVTAALGTFYGFGLIGLPVAAGGVALMGMARPMLRRSAEGSEALRRVLGFRLFIETAEQHRAEFAERANIFTEYLPYAIVFGCVEKWASVFRDEALREQLRSWYVSDDYSRLGRSFAVQHGFGGGVRTAMTSAAARTQGGLGISGFSGSSGGGGGGGSSGGGGGGGGGRSW